MSARGAGRTPSVAVVGAGMAGLAAAWRLQQAGLDVTVLEREPTVGGRVRTEQVHGFPVEIGAQFLTNFYSHTLELVRQLGLEGELQRLQGGGAIVHAGRPHPVWPAPQLLSSRLLPARGKLSLLGLASSVLRHWHELNLEGLHRAYRLDTRSVADLARARLDDQLVERLLRPGLEGFLFATPEQTSQAMLLALVKGGIGLRALYTLPPGLGRLPETLAGRLPVRCGTEVLGVRADASGGCEVLAAFGGSKRRIAVDAVVCATPASAVPSLFTDLDRGRREFFTAVRYVPAVRAVVALRRRLPSASYGLLFPREESRRLAIATVESAKHPDRVPPGQDLAVLYATPQAARELLGKDDAAVRDCLLADLPRAGPAFDLAPDELFTRVQRWEEALPEFGVGHFRRLRLLAPEVEWGAIAFAGDYLGGPLIEGAVISGLQAADRLLRRLSDAGGRAPGGP